MAINFQLEPAHRACRCPSIHVKSGDASWIGTPPGTFGPELVANTLTRSASFLVQGPSLTDWCAVRLKLLWTRSLDGTSDDRRVEDTS